MVDRIQPVEHALVRPIWPAVLVLATVLAQPGGASAMTCPVPLSQSEAEYTIKAKGQLAKLGPVAGAQVDTQITRTSKNLFADYPHADRVAVSHAVLSAACQIIAESKLSDEKKFDLLMRATEQVRQIVK